LVSHTASTQPEADARSARWARVAAYLPLALIVAVAAGLRFVFLGRQSYWYDESVTVELLHKSLGGLLYTLPHSESTPPLYYVVAWGWARVFGFGEVGLRSLSAVLGTATVAVAYLLARFLVSVRAAVFSSALLALSPMLIWYSQEARSYALLGFFCVASALAFAHALQAPTWRALLVWALVASLALTAHYFAVFVIAAEAVWLLVVHARSWATRAAVAAIAAVGAALLPLALHEQGSRTAWIGRIPLAARIRTAATEAVTSEYNPARLVLVLGWLAAAAAAVAGFVWLANERERRGARTLLVLGAAGVVVPLALAATRFDEFYYRNLIGAWILIAVSIGIIFASSRAGMAGVAPIALACSVELAALVSVIAHPSLQRDNWRGVTRSFASEPRPLAIVANPTYEQIPVEVYLPDARPMPAAGARVEQIVFLGSQIAARAFRPPKTFRLVEQRKTQAIVLLRFRARTRTRMTPTQITARSQISDLAVLLLPP
jgi:mannosyltransferase